MNTAARTATIETIATDTMMLDTIHERGNDDADFTEVHCTLTRKGLEEAYDAGHRRAAKTARPAMEAALALLDGSYKGNANPPHAVAELRAALEELG